MGSSKQPINGSRRWFFSKLLPGDNPAGPGEKVKMLTPDGKLVEVDKSIVQRASSNKKATNKDIYDWMQNPSKENS